MTSIRYHLLAVALAVACAGEARAAEVATETAADATSPPTSHSDTAKAGDTRGAPVKSTGEDEIDRIVVVGQRLFPYQEGMVLDEKYLDEQPKGNGDIGTALRINPNVQFDDTAFNSRNMGEIRPADISINGGLYYQNAFVLDGAGFSPDLDPASDNPNHYADPPSHAQGVAVDVGLLGRLTVFDSNVPASYGGFSGGVVEAETRRARDGFSGRFGVRVARSAWNERIIDEAAETTFEQSTTASNQPEYDKYQANLTLEGRSARGLGVIAHFTRTRSEIPLRGYSSGLESGGDENEKTQTRQNTSATLRVDWQNDAGLDLSVTATHAPTDERYFIQNSKNSWFDLKQGGPVASVRLGLERGAWTFSNTLSYSDLDASRRSEQDVWYTWRWSQDKNWGTSRTGNSLEGSWGNVDQTSRAVSYKFVADRAALRWGGTEHRLQFGLEMSDRRASYERLNDHDSYITPAATTTCTVAGVVDTIACSLSPVPSYGGRGQYLSRWTRYEAGEFEVSSREWALFAQDDIRAGRWSFRPGLRVDRDTLSDRTTVAPRFALSWDVFGDRRTLLTGGVNRYYGRNLFAYALREGRENLTVVRTRGANLVWGRPVRSTSSTRFDRLDVPYSDEGSLGLNQAWRDLEINLKYVHRRSRDEVMRVRMPSGDDSGYYDANVYEYRNVGRADSDIYTLGASTRRPWQWGPAETTAQLAFDHTQTRRSALTYETVFNDDVYNARIRFDGELMRYYELPSRGYNRPWTARLSSRTRIERWGLSWNNFLRYRAGYRGVLETGSEVVDGEPIDVYVSTRFPDGWTWDSALEYALDLPKDQQVYARVEVANLLNRRNLISGSGGSAYYEPGRSYWVEVGYRF